MKARKERAKARLETGEAAPTKKTIESMRNLFDKMHRSLLRGSKFWSKKFWTKKWTPRARKSCTTFFSKIGFKHESEKLTRLLSNQMMPKLNGTNKMMNLKIISQRNKRQKCF